MEDHTDMMSAILNEANALIEEKLEAAGISPPYLLATAGPRGLGLVKRNCPDIILHEISKCLQVVARGEVVSHGTKKN